VLSCRFPWDLRTPSGLHPWFAASVQTSELWKLLPHRWDVEREILYLRITRNISDAFAELITRAGASTLTVLLNSTPRKTDLAVLAAFLLGQFTHESGILPTCEAIETSAHGRSTRLKPQESLSIRANKGWNTPFHSLGRKLLNEYSTLA
jgi:hypothetical protein